MKGLKRITAAALCLCLLLAGVPCAQADGAKYSDWFRSGYMEMTNLGLLPDAFLQMDLTAAITRQEMCDLAVPALEKVTENSIEPARMDYFSDTQNLNVVKAHELGIVNGYADGTFKPENHLTRQEFFVIVLNFCRASSFQPNTVNASLEQFPDRAQVSQWALEAAQVCVKYSYVNGSLKDGVAYLNPKTSLSRQEAMTMFLRCFKGLSEYYYYVKNATVIALSGAGGNVINVGGVTVTDASGTMYVNAAKLNMRSTPNTGSSILATLNRWTEVRVTGVCSNQWFRISHNGKSGYVSGEYLAAKTGTSDVASDLAVTIANEALTFVGYPYVWGAESPKEGFDCSGLVYYVFGKHGISMNRVADDQMDQGNPVEYNDLLAGDLVFFGYGNYSDHVGIYIGNGNFVHAANPKSGVKVSAMSETYYANKYLGAKRLINS